MVSGQEERASERKESDKESNSATQPASDSASVPSRPPCGENRQQPSRFRVVEMHDDLSWMELTLNLRGNDVVPGAAGGTVFYCPPASAPREGSQDKLATGPETPAGTAERLEAYMKGLTSALGPANRAAMFRSYCVRLLLHVDETGLEQIEARVAPESVRVTQRALHYFVGQADWSDGAVLDAVRARVLPVIAQSGPIRGWMLNDIGTPKKGTHSVGVVRQSCGHLGRQDNCQVAVTLSVANDQASLPIAHRLFLPRAWADQPRRRARVGVPDEVAYQTRPQIALAQVCAALAAGVPPAPVLAGVGYGIDSDFRDALTKLGLQYVVGIQPSTSLWLPRVEPARTDRGKSSSVAGRNQDPKPVSATELVTGIPKSGWRPVTWLEGGDALLTSRFAAVRVRSAHGDEWRSAPRPEEWLLVEWPTGQPEPIGYWLATLPETTPRRLW